MRLLQLEAQFFTGVKNSVIQHPPGLAMLINCVKKHQKTCEQVYHVVVTSFVLFHVV